MNRRSFIKSVAAATASTFIVPGLILPAEPEKRFWALGGLPEKRYYVIGLAYPYDDLLIDQVSNRKGDVVAEGDDWKSFLGGSVFRDRVTGQTLWRAFDTQNFVSNAVVIG